MGAWVTTGRRTSAASSDPEGFWRDAAGAIDWDAPPGRVLDAAAAVLPLVSRTPG